MEEPDIPGSGLRDNRRQFNAVALAEKASLDGMTLRVDEQRPPAGPEQLERK